MGNRCAYCDAPLVGTPNEVEVCGESFCNLRCYEKHETGTALREIAADVRYNDHYELEGDWIVAADWHIPCHSTAWVMRAIDVAERFDVPNLIVPGDLINADEFAPFSVVERATPIRQEIQASQVVLQQLFKHFIRIVWLPGNHEARLAKFLNGRIEGRDLLRMFTTAEQVEVSRYQYAVILGPDGETTGSKVWRVTHPGNYRSTPTSVAQALCDRKGQNVLAGHGHMAGYVASPNLGLVAGDLGMMADEEKLFYRRSQDRIAPQWQNGFWMIRNGYGHLFWNFTDWDLWLGDKDQEHAAERCMVHSSADGTAGRD